MNARKTVTALRGKDGHVRKLQWPAYQLKVVAGPSKGLELRVDSERLVIGAGAAAQLRLEDRTVSALHCSITADTGGFRIRDLDSKNGVHLDKRHVVEAWLRDDDTFSLGTSTLRFRLLNDLVERDLASTNGFGKLKGSSVAMRTLYAQLESAARSDAPVLLMGETGTGKELASEALVSMGSRRDGPVIVVDCGRLPANLAESELFGHEAGAFTGSVRAHAGAFERARGGTVFLDEIGELPLELQAKLLGALGRGAITRVGGREDIRIDARIISATHRDLEREVNRGTFRADLFYRLAVLQVRLPPLRERPEDIPELVAHFIEESEIPGQLAPEVLRRLHSASYPGNVRELRSAVERALLGLGRPPPPPPNASVAIDLSVPYRAQKESLLESFDRAYLTRLLAAAEGNVSAAARQSGISRVHLYDLMRRLGIGP